MSHRKRNDEPGAVFHLTARVNWQAWHLAPAYCAQCFLDCLVRSAEEFDVNLIGFVLMSNHYHFVAQSPEAPDYARLTSRRTPCRHFHRWPDGHPKASVLSQFMKKLMHQSSRAIQKHLGINGRFWKGPYHSRRIRDASDLVGVLAYDHLNPIVQGMADAPENYRRSSAAWWNGAGESLVPLVIHGLPFDLDEDQVRHRLAKYQTNELLLRAMKDFRAAGGQIFTARGQAMWQALLAERNLECGPQFRTS